MNFENLRIGYLLLFIGGIFAFAQICLVAYVPVSSGEYKPFGSYLGQYAMIIGFILIKIEKILDNQKEIIKALNENQKTDVSASTETHH